MALRTPAVQLHLKTFFLLLLGALVEAAQEQGSMYMWIDANQARILIGFEEDILIVSEGKMAPFTHDFRKAQQRMPAIPVNIQHVNFTWQATEQAEYFYEFQTLRSLDKDIMDDPTVNVPLLGSVPHKASVVQVGFPCRGDQDGVAAFEVTILVMDAGGNIILRTPHNAIFFKTCQRAKCPGGCRNGGYCNERQVCECQDGFYGIHCEKALCSPRCLNGGLCMSPGVCICPPGYFGPSCDRANCSTTCLNGGTCFHPGKCICAVGFEGSRCELSEFSYVNVDSHAEMEANAQGGINASAAKATMAICAPKLSASPAVEHTGPVWSPTGASAGTAGMDVTAIRDFVEESPTASGSLVPSTSPSPCQRRTRRKCLNPVSPLKPTMWFKPPNFGSMALPFQHRLLRNKAFILLIGTLPSWTAAFSERELFCSTVTVSYFTKLAPLILNLPESLFIELLSCVNREGSESHACGERL